MKSNFFSENPVVTVLLIISTTVTIFSACLNALSVTIISAIFSCVVAFYSGIGTHETLVDQEKKMKDLEQKTKRHDDEIKNVKQQADESTNALIWDDVKESEQVE